MRYRGASVDWTQLSEREKALVNRIRPGVVTRNSDWTAGVETDGSMTINVWGISHTQPTFVDVLTALAKAMPPPTTGQSFMGVRIIDIPD